MKEICKLTACFSGLKYYGCFSKLNMILSSYFFLSIKNTNITHLCYFLTEARKKQITVLDL